MRTTTIRVDTVTHARLVELSQLAGATLIETVSEAAEALRRQRFTQQVAGELGELREDSDRWEAYVTEADATSVTDGIG